MYGWSPSHSNAIHQIERVQRKFTKGLPGFGQLSYLDRLSKSKLESLEVRRLHNDLIMTYKVLAGLVDVDADASGFFRMSTLGTIRAAIALSCLVINAESTRVSFSSPSVLSNLGTVCRQLHWILVAYL